MSKHKEEHRNIQLNLGDVSLNESLGVYYIDMRNAEVHYTQNIYGGKFDENGVPMCSGQKGLYYSPVNIAQYGFILHAKWLEDKNPLTLKKMTNCIAVLDSLKQETVNGMAWYNDFDSVQYNIRAPWVSSMALGEIISFYLRVYQINQDENLLKTANKTYQFLKLDVKEGGVRRHDEYGNLWFEEYPSTPPSYVLNGYIYTIFGLYDLYRVTKNAEVYNDILTCIQTLENRLNEFDSGFWSYYDLQKKELVRYYYQKNVHVPQLEVLFILTQKKVFEKYKKKWKRQIHPLNFLFVKAMYRVQFRLPQLYKLIDRKWKN